MPDLEPLLGGSIPWTTVTSSTVSWHPYDGQSWPYGRPDFSDFDLSRGDWVYVPNRATPVSGSLFFNGSLTTHNGLTNNQKQLLTYIWVDWKTDPGHATYMTGVPNMLSLYSGSIEYVYIGVKDTRDGRNMGVYQLRTFTVTTPPSGSHSGSYYWKDVATGYSVGYGNGQWVPAI